MTVDETQFYFMVLYDVYCYLVLQAGNVWEQSKMGENGYSWSRMAENNQRHVRLCTSKAGGWKAF